MPEIVKAVFRLKRSSAPNQFIHIDMNCDEVSDHICNLEMNAMCIHFGKVMH